MDQNAGGQSDVPKSLDATPATGDTAHVGNSPTIVLPADDQAAIAPASRPSEPPATMLMPPAGSENADPAATIITPPPGTAATVDPTATCVYTPGAFPDDDSITVNDQVLVKGYEIQGELGRGGMGVVYRARQLGLNRIVALKMILAGGHAGSEQLARFHAEAEAVGHLQHPNIVQVYDVGEQDGLPYFSLEFIDGASLDKEIDGKPLPPMKAAQTIGTLAQAIQYAHSHGIVHRDLKPANVLLTSTGVLKITDFGLAKQLDNDSSQTRTGTVMGTPAYMAPEQGRGQKDVGPLADVYALGSMLFEMLTGRPPFLSATPLDTLMRLLHEEPVPPSRLQPNVSRDLETVCLKCLQKDPQKRYASAGALADDLQRFQAGEPILARPVSRPERIWRWCKRNPRIAALSSAVAVLLVTSCVALSVTGLRMLRDKAAIQETRKLAQQRLDQAGEAIASGNYRRAQDFLQASDPLLETSAGLADVRDAVHLLKDQVNLYAEFKDLLENARYHGLASSKEALTEAHDYCIKLILLSDEIDARTGRAKCGLPPLSPAQQQLFQEDLFDAFLVTAIVKWDVATAAADPVARRDAARWAVERFDRAEKKLPPTKTLYSRRYANWMMLSELEPDEPARQRAKAAAEADFARAGEITATSPVDRFWHGYAEQLRGNTALKRGDTSKAREHFLNAIAQYVALLRIQPGHYWGYYYFASSHFQLDDFNDAIVGFTAGINISPEMPWTFLQRGLAYHQLKQYDLAMEDFGQVLKAYPKNAEAYGNQAQTLLALGDSAAAIKAVDQVVELRPNDSQSYLKRGRAYRSLQRDTEALRDYEQALKLNPKSAEAFFQRGSIYLSQKKTDVASKDFAAAVSFDPNYAPASSLLVESLRTLKRYPEALKECDRMLQLNPRSAEAICNRGTVYQAQNNTTLAMKDYDQAILLDSNYAAAWFQRAEVNRLLKRYDDALRDYDRAQTLRSNHPQTLAGRALVHLAQSNHRSARDDFSAAIQLQPTESSYYRLRGILNLLLKDFDGSLADWAEFQRMQPASADPHYYRGVIETARRNYDPALASLTRAIEVKSDDPKSYSARAHVYHRRGQLNEALQDINHIVEKLAPKNASLLNSRPDIYRNLGRLDEAIADWKRSIELSPKQIDAYLGLASIYEQQGKLDEARQCYEQMIAADPNSAEAYRRRAEFRRNQGEYDPALADCDLAAQKDPKSFLPALVRASVTAARGDYVAATKAAEQILPQAPADNGQVLYAAAAVWSLATQAAARETDQSDASERAKQLSDRGASLLSEVLGKCVNDLNYQEYNRIPYDPAIAAIRQHPSIQPLLASPR